MESSAFHAWRNAFEPSGYKPSRHKRGNAEPETMQRRQPVELESVQMAARAAGRSLGGRAGQPQAMHLPGGRHGVLLFHGLSSSPLELQYLARGLHRAGYTVRIAVIDGYSFGLGGAKQARHEDWQRSALAEFDAMRSEVESLAVGGLCIGALLALSVAASRPTGVSAVLGMSTTLYYDGWANPWTRHILPILRWVPFAGRIQFREREPYGVKDERLRRWIAAQMRESGSSDAGAAALRVRDLIQAKDLGRTVRGLLKDVSAPTLLIHARHDECVAPRSAFEVAKGVRSRQVQVVLLDDCYHMVSIDREKTRVLNEMKLFLKLQQPDVEPIPTTMPSQLDTAPLPPPAPVKKPPPRPASIDTLTLVRRVLSKYCDSPREAIVPEALLTELNVDSLALAEMLFALEDNLGVAVTVSGDRPTTVADLMKVIEPYMKQLADKVTA